MFRIQQRLAARVQQPGERLSDFATSLTSIGFGKRVPVESYVEAFINGINNDTTATQVRTYEPTTLDEAVQFAEDKCGEYGEGFKVTDWRVAKRRYREEHEYGAEDDTQPAKKKPPTTESVDQLDWKNWAWAGLGREETVGGKAASSKAKVTRALEVKSEGGKQSSPDKQASNQRAGWQNPAVKAVAMPVDKAAATEATAADKLAAEAAVEEAASEAEEPAVVKASDVDAEAEADVGD
ncbi:hypothetical protein PF004_g24807 [Phytophthora fragariae]|uniref:Retrotransposon gag domain-containing protein n=1 Tax=Phytophthora fragariae TaxID=53985 RepID=A0A6G0MT49_9STRA|nr:hypothetical protein PF004_g24807 [Phytophthora fragariae]